MATNKPRGKLAAKVTHHIEFTGGNFELRQVKTATITDNATGEIVVNGNGVMGTIHAEGGFSGSLEIHRVVEVPDEVPWESLRDTKEYFVYAIQDVAGTRRNLLNCTVTKVDVNAPNDGQLTMTVEFLCEKKKLVQPESAA